MVITDRLERALRWAAVGHAGQARRASGVPYFQHVVAVAMALDRLGYSEDLVIAGLLHDIVEDTPATPDEVRERFGPTVAELVAFASEVKTDSEGARRPWIDRKRDHLGAMADAPPDARALMLADKLHNLVSVARDLRDGVPIWATFHAPRDQVLWYYRAAIHALARDDDGPRLARLGDECRRALAEVEAL